MHLHRSGRRICGRRPGWEPEGQVMDKVAGVGLSALHPRLNCLPAILRDTEDCIGRTAYCILHTAHGDFPQPIHLDQSGRCLGKDATNQIDHRSICNEDVIPVGFCRTTTSPIRCGPTILSNTSHAPPFLHPSRSKVCCGTELPLCITFISPESAHLERYHERSSSKTRLLDMNARA